jgi:NAD(P)-dependent dehydrogenase (short-subunit alcohol dehydrogenase family)
LDLTGNLVGALEGKTAVVTGASSGVGLGVAQRFVEEGAIVALLARDGERLETTARELGPAAVSFATDVGDPTSVRESFAKIGDRFGKIDILVNNAAVYRPCRVELLSDSEIHQQIATNLAGPVYTCRAAIPLLRAAGGGDIVNTSSESTLRPFPMLSMYVATKAALEAFAVVLAQEVRDDDIRLTTVILGGVKGAGGGSTGWEWDPDHGAEAIDLWTNMGLMSQAYGRNNGQEVAAVADVHLFVVTRPRTQKMDTVFCRSF